MIRMSLVRFQPQVRFVLGSSVAEQRNVSHKLVIGIFPRRVQNREMNILFLENHQIFAETVVREFLKEHHVTIVPSLAEARAVFAVGRYDVVLVDYDLDDGKGDAFVAECRTQHPKIPIIAVSSHERGNVALVSAGAAVICSKMEFNRIGEVLKALRAVHNEAPKNRQ